MKKNIYINDWLAFKPYNNHSATDTYYLKICNEVKKAIVSIPYSSDILDFLVEDEIDALSCILTSYFEDLVSQTNIWSSFVSMHHQLYNKHLPFFPCEDYLEEEINEQDVRFLFWYFVNTVQDERFISPETSFFEVMAEVVMTIFEDAWETAPENHYLKSFYHLDQNETDFYVVRNLIDTILFKTYLFHFDTFSNLFATELELFKTEDSENRLLALLNENRDTHLHTSHTRLLALHGREWASEVLGKAHKLAGNVLRIKDKISGYFLYKGQDENYIYLEHIASGMKFQMVQKSFDPSAELLVIDSILFIGISQWLGEWWFSGMFFQQPFSADLILDEKNSVKSRKAVIFLENKNKTDEVLKMQMETFLAFNGGYPIAFVSSDGINEFVKDYTAFFNSTLNLSPRQVEKAHARARKEGFFLSENHDIHFSEEVESALVFFNPKSGIEIGLGINSAFPLPHNPYFDTAESDDAVMTLLTSENVSTELARFCIDKCRKDLAFFQAGYGKLYLKDIDFLLRFWKSKNYHTVPGVSFTGR